MILRRRKSSARPAASSAPPTRPSSTKRGSGSFPTARLLRNPIQSTYSIRVDGPCAEIERITPGGQTPVEAAKRRRPSLFCPVFQALTTRSYLAPRRLPRPTSVSALATKSTWPTPNRPLPLTAPSISLVTVPTLWPSTACPAVILSPLRWKKARKSRDLCARTARE